MAQVAGEALMALASFSRRQLDLAGFLACAAMMGYALYAEHFQGLLPCNMCILERICVCTLGVAFLLPAVHNAGRIGAALYGSLIALVAIVGVLVSGRHVWVQMQPAGSLPSCGADFSALLDMMPVREAVTRVLSGGAECQAITWSLFGVSMPVWLALSILVLGLAGLMGNLRLERAPAR